MIQSSTQHDPLSRRAVVGSGLAAVVTGAALIGAPDAAEALPVFADSHRATVRADSPDGRTSIVLQLANGRIHYRALVHGAEVVPASPLGLTLDDADLASGLTMVDRGRERTVRLDYRLLQGKRAHVRTSATERVVTLSAAGGQVVQVLLWAGAQGVAVRYRVPADAAAHRVLQERTGITLRIPKDGGAQLTLPYTAGAPKDQEFFVQRDQHTMPRLGDAVRSQLNPTGGASYPLLARTVAANGTKWWVLASESGEDGTYPACHLGQPVRDGAARTATFTVAFPTDDEALGTFGSGTPEVSGTWHSPWRFLALARTAAEAAETTLATDLAVPCRVADTSWITPGAASFSWLTDHDSPLHLERIVTWFDLAASLGWPYSLVDAEWDRMTDATGAAVPLERLVEEADRRGVKLFLWYNSAGTNNDATTNTPRDALVDPATRRATMEHLSRLGVAGLKVDGWQSDKQDLMALQRDVLEDAARYRLHIVLHNTTVPRGWDRTYPHLLGVEAGIASEYYANAKPYTDQIPEQNTIAAITRNAIGPFDYGTTLFSPGLVAGSDRRTSDAHELALTVVYQSGFNGFADSPDSYLRQEPAVRHVLSTVPQVWDETRFLAADPGRLVVVARRRGRTWWIGGINGVTTTISPGLDTAAPGYRPPTGQPLVLAAHLRQLGIARGASIDLFSDRSATDRTLGHVLGRGTTLRVQTCAFGGFLAVVREPSR